MGLVTLVVGAEAVVRAGTQLAGRLGIPPIVVGITVVSVGTSAPELAVGIDASLRDVGALAVGNIAGTNMVNLLLILGLSAAIRPIAMGAQTFRLDVPAMALAALALVAMSLDGEISRLDGLLLLVIAVAYTAIVVQLSLRQRAANRAQVITKEWMPSRRRVAGQVGADLAVLLLGIAVIVLGADWLVRGASWLARDLGVSHALIGLTVVAIGTSAPELATTLVSTVRNNREIAIGNLIGSSVYNIAFILGVTVLVAPISIGGELVRVDLPLMAAVALLCLPVFRTGRRVSRTEGVVFVVLYLAYLAYLVVART
nr:calcium/sodium antiporter [Ornithinimicrobium sp. F0845]